MKHSFTEAGWLALGIATGLAVGNAASLSPVLDFQVDPVPFAQAAVFILLAGTVRPQRSSRRLRAGKPVVRSANGSWGRPPFSRPRRFAGHDAWAARPDHVPGIAAERWPGRGSLAGG